uniref:IMS import disulfide relay-system CHCH-CHCH-like Cx9C domain-containing protein n=1 Tax=Populus trichocarpa TaxID=3694 RepID=A9PAQ6_POPTR|nr:unknown [Populus trichocarpa]
MGRKIGGLFFNTKKRRIAAKPCMQEMISFLSCLSQNQMNDERCLHSKELLKTCLDDETAKSKKKRGSMNYHLQRLNKKISKFLDWHFKLEILPLRRLAFEENRFGVEQDNCFMH